MSLVLSPLQAMSASLSVDTSTTTSSLQLRTSLLESVRRVNEAYFTTTPETPGPADEGGSDNTGYSARDANSLLKAFVRHTPGITNPTWAMEECGRLCPNVELWCGSALPRSVWGPPGTPDCPFTTEPADYRIHH